MVYTMEWSGGFYQAIFYFLHIKSGGPYKSGGFLWSAGYYEKKKLHKIRWTNSMVYTIVLTCLYLVPFFKEQKRHLKFGPSFKGHIKKGCRPTTVYTVNI
jgi:glycopeptide antibiotics resistance protein